MSPWGNVIGGCSPLWVTPSPGQGILSHIKKLAEIPASQPASSSCPWFLLRFRSWEFLGPRSLSVCGTASQAAVKFLLKFLH